MRKVVAFYESPFGAKLGQTALAISNEASAMMQLLGMEMAKEIMPQLQNSRSTVRDNMAEQNRKSDQRMFDAAYTIPQDSIELADKTYQPGMGTTPLLYSIERRKNDTKVTFLQPIHYDWQWLHFSQGFKIVDKKSGDEYNVNDDGVAKSYFNVKVEGYQVTFKKNKKICN